jgi:hypothetical protein
MTLNNSKKVLNPTFIIIKKIKIILRLNKTKDNNN